MVLRLAIGECDRQPIRLPIEQQVWSPFINRKNPAQPHEVIRVKGEQKTARELRVQFLQGMQKKKKKHTQSNSLFEKDTARDLKTHYTAMRLKPEGVFKLLPQSHC